MERGPDDDRAPSLPGVAPRRRQWPKAVAVAAVAVVVLGWAGNTLLSGVSSRDVRLHRGYSFATIDDRHGTLRTEDRPCAAPSPAVLAEEFVRAVFRDHGYRFDRPKAKTYVQRWPAEQPVVVRLGTRRADVVDSVRTLFAEVADLTGLDFTLVEPGQEPPPADDEATPGTIQIFFDRGERFAAAARSSAGPVRRGHVRLLDPLHLPRCFASAYSGDGRRLDDAVVFVDRRLSAGDRSRCLRAGVVAALGLPGRHTPFVRDAACAEDAGPRLSPTDRALLGALYDPALGVRVTPQDALAAVPTLDPPPAGTLRTGAGRP